MADDHAVQSSESIDPQSGDGEASFVGLPAGASGDPPAPARMNGESDTPVCSNPVSDDGPAIHHFDTGESGNSVPDDMPATHQYDAAETDDVVPEVAAATLHLDTAASDDSMPEVAPAPDQFDTAEKDDPVSDIAPALRQFRAAGSGDPMAALAAMIGRSESVAEFGQRTAGHDERATAAKAPPAYDWRKLAAEMPPTILSWSQVRPQNRAGGAQATPGTIPTRCSGRKSPSLIRRLRP